MSTISLRRRVLLSMIAVIVLCMACMSLYLHGTRDVLRRGLMLIQAKEIAADFIATGDLARLPRMHAGGEVSYTLYSATGEALWISPDLARPLRLRADSLEALSRRFWHRIDVGRVINVPVPLDDGRTLMVARHDRQERAAIEALLDTRLKHSLALLVPLAVLLCGLIWALMAWTLAPVRKATLLAEKIAPGRATPIPEASLPGEIRPLARALNHAVVRLDETLDAERQILADGAHELRTPLAVLTLRLQKFEQDGHIDWPVLNDDLQRLRRVTEQLLLLARQDHAALAQGADTCRLAAVAREVIAELYPLFEAQGRTLLADLGRAEPVVHGTAGSVREALANLVENALVHGAGTVRVSLAMEAHDDGASHARLDVEDLGPGIPVAQQHEYFRRFRKSRQDSPGAGLGLAIVRRIMDNLGGTVDFVSQSPCVVRLRFVARPPGPPAT